jgi:uncharacterized membrane protein YphA (DoxX/SURF4 family)
VTWHRLVTPLSGALLGIRWLMGGIFILSGITKIRSPYAFLANVYSFELTGPAVGTVVAAAVPWFEMVFGICLLGGVAVGGALIGTALLSCVFIFVQAHAIQAGLGIACGCFGSSDPAEVIGGATILRSTATLGLTTAGYVLFLTLPAHQVLQFHQAPESAI